MGYYAAGDYYSAGDELGLDLTSDVSDMVSGGWLKDIQAGAQHLLPEQTRHGLGQKGHFKKDGTWSDRKRPVMNAGNAKALRRSMRRVQSFAKLARRVMTFTHHHKLKKRRR